MNIIIENAKPDDIYDIYNLGKNVGEFETSKDVINFWPLEILKNCVNKEDVIIKIAIINDLIVGFMIVNVNKSLKKAELENMYVVEEYRKKGIATKVLDEIINDLKRMGIENINAMSNESMNFLMKNGFSKGKDFFWMNLVLNDRFKK